MAQCRKCGGNVRWRYPGGDPENGPAERVCVDCGTNQYVPSLSVRVMDWVENVKYDAHLGEGDYSGPKVGTLRALWLGLVAWPFGVRLDRLVCRLRGHDWRCDCVDPENGYEAHSCARCGQSFEARF
jgi:hypothetical protein